MMMTFAVRADAFRRHAAQPSELRHIALIGNALPRRCGLATFTSDTLSGLKDNFPDMAVDLYAMDDGTGITYAEDIHTIAADDPAAYRHAAALIEASGAQAIWLQHEYGIFGGAGGEHILRLLERSTLPLVVTLHTVLQSPDATQRRVLEALVRRADHLIVMAQRGREMLEGIYGVPAAKISVIPHGVPDRPLVDTAVAKAAFGLAGRRTILTFGLLAPDKGIETMIAAMPAIVAAVPESTYIVLGATHPNLRRTAGEAYREQLQAQAATLGVGEHVRFVDAFVEQAELLRWLEAADVYVTPYRKADQITSGTLSYAVGLGKPVVSTPYIHATEILADGVGTLVDFNDAAALGNAVTDLLADDTARLTLAQRAYACGRAMTWACTSAAAVAILAASARAARGPTRGRVSRPAMQRPLPVDLGALMRMTDGTGLLQHAIHGIPDRRHGYCIDDNARALLLSSRLTDIAPSAQQALATTYAAFVQHAWNPDAGRFRNFMRFDRSWCEDTGSEDSNGRALWALGVTAAESPVAAMRHWARGLFAESAPLALTLESPRALAFAMLGAAALIEVLPDDATALRILEDGGARLLTCLAAAQRPDWFWFEPVLAYDNARLPEAMIRAALALGRDDLMEAGLRSLRWIIGQQTAPNGHFRPVGTDSFFRDYAAPLRFDQQPLEAQATIDACEAALRATGEDNWVRHAHAAYRWFLGSNDLETPIAEADGGGCHDGLMPHGVNRNQGAESILALLLSTIAISAFPAERTATKQPEIAA